MIDMTKEHATGEWTVGRHQWHPGKWAVYSPTGVCCGRYDNRNEAETERGLLEAADRRKMQCQSSSTS